MDAGRSGRAVLILFAAALLALGTLLGGAALAETIGGGFGGGPTDGGGGGATPGGGGTAPVDTLPGRGGSPTDTIPAPTIPPITPPPTRVIIPDADIGVTKTGPATATAGGNIAYTLVVTNNGPDEGTGVSLSDTLPSPTTFVSLTENSGPPFACTTPAVGASGAVACSLEVMGVGASASFTLVASVPAATGPATAITNTATVSSTTIDPNPTNDASSTGTTVAVPTADVAVTKTAPATAIDGTNISYAIKVTNSGPGAADGVTLTDALPAHTSFQSATSSAGSCAVATGTLTCNLGSINSGATVNVALVVKLDMTTASGTVVSNTATTSATTTDPNPANNSATANTMAAAALQSIAVAPAGKTLAPGMTEQYTATGSYSDGSTKDLTGSAAWASSATGVAAVNATGVVAATAPGTTNITASDSGQTGTAGLQVSPLRSITVRPLVNIVRTGGSRALTATGRFANGVTATITDQVTWVSTNSGIAGVSPQGVLTAHAPGGVAVFAVFGRTLTLPAGVLVL